MNAIRAQKVVEHVHPNSLLKNTDERAAEEIRVVDDEDIGRYGQILWMSLERIQVN